MKKSGILGTINDFRTNLFNRVYALGAVSVTVDRYENSEFFQATDANGNIALRVTIWTKENAYTIHETLSA